MHEYQSVKAKSSLSYLSISFFTLENLLCLQPLLTTKN